MLIGQISFHWMDQPVANRYDGKYQGQRGPNASRFHESFDVQPS
jgi:deoxycytidine triphosphate deaminase